MQQSQNTRLVTILARTFSTIALPRQQRQLSILLSPQTLTKTATNADILQLLAGATCEPSTSSPSYPSVSSKITTKQQSNHGQRLKESKIHGNILAWSKNSPSLCGNRPVIPCRTYCKFTAACDQSVFAVGMVPLCEERAHDLIANLKDSEREAIKVALAKYDAIKQKEGYEGKLAATQWRSRFGRPTKVPALGDVDPSGTFCAFPDDWLKKKAAEKAVEPSRSDLMKIFFVNAVPFMAFGFLDNFTMIIAGDYIEQLFGYFMCISTMAAAGLGNTISDILGIGSAYYVERSCELMGLKPPDLTPVQMEMKSSRRSANNGRMIGITIGCIVGMFPLLFMDKATSEDATATEATPNKVTPKPITVST